MLNKRDFIKIDFRKNIAKELGELWEEYGCPQTSMFKSTEAKGFSLAVYPRDLGEDIMVTDKDDYNDKIIELAALIGFVYKGMGNWMIQYDPTKKWSEYLNQGRYKLQAYLRNDFHTDWDNERNKLL